MHGFGTVATSCNWSDGVLGTTLLNVDDTLIYLVSHMYKSLKHCSIIMQESGAGGFPSILLSSSTDLQHQFY